MSVLPNKFLGCADYRRLEPRIAADGLDTPPQRGVCDVPEIPRHQVLYAMHGRDGNMQRISRLSGRNRAARREMVSQVPNRIGNVQTRQGVDFIKPLLRRRWIATRAFADHKLGNQ